MSTSVTTTAFAWPGVVSSSTYAAMRSGKFHGITWPATPSGRAFRPGKA